MGNFANDEFEYFTIERRDEDVVVYGHGVYGRGSVLEGQARKAFIDSFPDVAAAQKAYPQASVGNTPKLSADPGPIPPQWYNEEDIDEPWNPD